MLTNNCNGSASLADGSEEDAIAGEARKPIVVMGSAFLDIIGSCEHPNLASYNKELHDARSLVKEQFLRFKGQLIDPIIVPGGSAANATAIFAQLGGKASFYSTVGRDTEGETWRTSLNNLGVDMQLHICDSEHTGGCLVYVHPGGERSMRTYGGTENVADNNLDSINFDEKPIVFVEGYGLSNKNKAPVYLGALQRAKAKGSYIVVSAFDLDCVKRQRDVFVALLQTTADLFIMNEEEARELASEWVSSEGIEGDLQACIEFIQTTGKRAVITLGASGAIAVDGEDIWHCSARDVAVVDTLGAGDAFAGGFLYGHSFGWETKECLQLGSYMAGEVVSCCGARLAGEDLRSIVSSGTHKDMYARQIRSLKELAVGVVDPVVDAEE